MKNKILSTVILSFIILNSVKGQPLKVDELNSKVYWQTSGEIGGHNGTIAVKDGIIVFVKENIIGGVVNINMKAISIIDTDDDEQEKHLIKEVSGNQFFNVEKYPSAKFKITSFSKGLLTGDFTLTGITNTIQFKATSTKIGKKIIVESGEFPINLEKWGLKFSKWFKLNNSDNCLNIRVHIETIEI